VNTAIPPTSFISVFTLVLFCFALHDRQRRRFTRGSFKKDIAPLPIAAVWPVTARNPPRGAPLDSFARMAKAGRERPGADARTIPGTELYRLLGARRQ